LRLSSVSRIENLATSCLLRRQHPANANVHHQACGQARLFRLDFSQTPVRSSLTTMFGVSVQDTRPNSPCRMGIIRPTEGRGTASSSLLEACRRIDPVPHNYEGHLCGWPEHNYMHRRIVMASQAHVVVAVGRRWVALCVASKPPVMWIIGIVLCSR
jgi:hypothetical protein